MRPLSLERPKVLLPVNGVPLLDHAVERLREVTGAIAVNAHHTQPQLAEHVQRSGHHLSVESGEALGTAGALGALRDWIDGRGAVVVNADTWCPGGIGALVDGWDGERIRILVGGRAPFGPRSRIAGALMPWTEVATLAAEPTGLWEVSWRSALDDGRIETIAHYGPFHDCAGPAEYLAANLAANGGRSVVDPAADVEPGVGPSIGPSIGPGVDHGGDRDGDIVDSVVWAGAVVRRGERLRRAIRTPNRTVLVRTVGTPSPTSERGGS